MKKLFIGIRFYFFAVLFFIQGIWNKIFNSTTYITPQENASGEINLLNDGEINTTPKPSSIDAIGNKAKAGFSQIPEEHKGKLVWIVTVIVFFLLFGIANFIYWAYVIIKAYQIVGWFLIGITCSFISYKISKGVYKWFKEKRYLALALSISIIWEEAKLKSQLKFQNK